MATLLKERSTYWVMSGGSNYDTYFDYRGYWKIYYEQSDADKKLLRTKLIVDYYLQTHRHEDAVGIADSTSLNVLINGSSIGTVSANTNTVEVGNKLIKKGSKSTYIYHNADGTASFTFQGKGFGSNTAVSTYSLPKLNVGTSITNNSSGYIDFGSNVTFTLTKPVESHLNTLYFKIGDTTYTIASSTSDTSVNYAFNEDLIVNYPDNEKISLTVYCKNETSGIETSTTVYLSVPSSYVPSASLAIADVMSNKPSVLDGLWIKNQSQLKGTITASGVKGSSIKSYLSLISGFSQQYTSNPFTTQPLTLAGSRTVSATVTDSRDRKKTITQNINVIDYVKPTITSLSVKRCLEDGTLSESGTWAKVICKYSISPINNLNTKTLKVYLGGGYEDVNTLSSYSGEFSKVVYSGIRQERSYTIKVVLTDLFGDVPQEFILGIAYKTVSKRAGGQGITFGRVATQDGFHCHMEGRFHNRLQVDGDLVAEIMAIQSSSNSIINPNTKGHVKFLYNVNNGTEHLFDVTNNANAIIHINKHSGNYDSQLGFSSNGRIYYKSANGNTLDSVGWKKIAFSEDIKSLIYVTQSTTTSFASNAVGKIPLDTENIKVGNKFSFDSTNNRVIVGSDVTLIEVTATCKFQVTTANKNAFLRLYKNGTQIATWAGSTGNSSNLQETITVTMPLTVTSGDYIELYCIGENSAISSYLNNSLYIKEL